MDLKELFDLQRELDLRILNEHNLQGEVLFSQKALALQVELGELANETRCFKYWSNKGPSAKQVIIEEFVDCLHFILSMGLDKNYEDIAASVSQSNNEITEQFLDIFVDVYDFLTICSRDHYITLFEDFLSLGLSLDFTEEEIHSAYIKKNEINHERQNTGY